MVCSNTTGLQKIFPNQISTSDQQKSNKTFKMVKLFLILSALVSTESGILYTERHTLDFNKKLCNFSVAYTHDRRGRSVTNLTLQNFVIITKALLYMNIRCPENPGDREYRREVVNTVIDLKKFVGGLQLNPVLRGYIAGLKASFDWLDFPLPPVSKQ